MANSKERGEGGSRSVITMTKVKKLMMIVTGFMKDVIAAAGGHDRGGRIDRFLPRVGFQTMEKIL